MKNTQVRTELLASITAVHAVLREQLGGEDVRLILGWLDRFARFPIGAGGLLGAMWKFLFAQPRACWQAAAFMLLHG